MNCVFFKATILIQARVSQSYSPTALICTHFEPLGNFHIEAQSFPLWGEGGGGHITWPNPSLTVQEVVGSFDTRLPSICNFFISYLLLVISFTPAGFLNPGFYTPRKGLKTPKNSTNFPERLCYVSFGCC